MKTVNPVSIILYIEDDPSSKKLLQALAENYAGIRLITAWSAEEGIKLANEYLPALVFIDINLPCMCGNEALACLKNNQALSNTKFYALSANALPEHIDNALNNGFDGYITKPVDLHNIARIIENVFQL